MALANPVVCGDNTFGPSVKSVDCRGGFDFTSKSRIRDNHGPSTKMA